MTTLTANTKIEADKQVTSLILEAIRPYFKQVFVAGGAPRNWKFQQSAEDLDIYAVQKEGVEFSNEQLGVVLQPAFQKLESYLSEFNPPSDTYIFNHARFDDYKGNSGQLMIVDSKFDLKSTLETFDIGLCMIAWDGIRFIYSEEYVEDIINKTLTYRRENSKTDHHIRKIEGYYPD